MPSACVFCRILAGDLPACFVRRDDRIAAFLDIHPVSRGHVLLLPVEHHAGWADLPADLAADLARASQAIARAAVAATGAEGFNLLQNTGRCSGQAVDHVHLHVIPRRSGDGIRYGWPAAAATPPDLERVAEGIRTALATS